MSNHKKATEILMVTLKYPPSVGGMQNQSKALIEHLSNITRTHRIIFSNQYPLIFFIPVLMAGVIWKLIRYPQIRIVHANEALTMFFLTPFLLMRKRKFWTTVHGLDVVFKVAPYQWWIRNIMSKCEGIIAVSEQTRQLCIKAGIPPLKVHYIANACDIPEKITPRPDFKAWLGTKHGIGLQGKVLLASVGRPIPRKGFVWFIKKVLSQLPEQYVYVIAGPEQSKERFLLFLKRNLPTATFKMVCQLYDVGQEYFDLRDLAEDPSFKNRFRFLGRLPDEHLQQLYSQCDLFLMPNLPIDGDFEGFGLVALEATAQGAVCLASDVDGIPSAISHGHNGLLLAPGNPEVWKNEVQRLTTNPELLGSCSKLFSQNLRNQNYGWRHMAERYLSAFEKNL